MTRDSLAAPYPHDLRHTDTDDAMATRAVTAATIGTALEWFDFTLYGTVAATVLPKLFFPAMDPTSALLASLATFGVGWPRGRWAPSSAATSATSWAGATSCSAR